MKIKQIVLSFAATLGMVSCMDVPADYYTQLNDVFNGVVVSTTKIDAKIQSNDTTGVADMVANMKVVKNALIVVGPFRQDSSLINPIVDFVDLYSDNFMNGSFDRFAQLATADSLVEEQAVELELIKSSFTTIAQESLINAMNAHKDFQVKYELMNGHMVAE